MWRSTELTLLAALGPALCSGQFELGAGAGGYVYSLRGPGDGGHSYASFTSDQAFPFTASILYRERLPNKANLFTEVSYVRKEFTAHINSGGLGGGIEQDVDVGLDLLYLTFGPEFGKGSTTFRFGLQWGAKLGGTMVGRSSGWGMGPPYHHSSDTIMPTSPDPFTGDLRLLLAIRHCIPITARYQVMIDPYLSAALTSMLKGDEQRMVGTDFGLRVGFLLNFPPRGIWKRLRAGPLKVRIKE